MPSDRVRHLEHLAGDRVAGYLIAGERVPLVRAVDAVGDRAGQEFGIPERVGQPVRGERVLEVASVADQRPAGSPRPAQVAGPPPEGPQATWRLGGGEPGEEVGCRLGDDL